MDQKNQNQDKQQMGKNQQQVQQQRQTGSHETRPTDKSRQQTGNQPSQSPGMGQNMK